MRYLGSKIKLLPQIESVIKKYKIKGKSFADLFAGTCCVGDYFKGKYKIISNDFMNYSYVISKAKLSFKNSPQYNKFKEKYKVDIYEWLNNKEYKPVATNISSTTKTKDMEKFDLKGAKGKYVKIVGHGNSQNEWNNITELVLCGK